MYSYSYDTPIYCIKIEWFSVIETEDLVEKLELRY